MKLHCCVFYKFCNIESFGKVADLHSFMWISGSRILGTEYRISLNKLEIVYNCCSVGECVLASSSVADPQSLWCGSGSCSSLWCGSESCLSLYADPYSTFHLDADQNPDTVPSFQIEAQNLEKVLKLGSYSKHFGFSSANSCGSRYGSGSVLSLWYGSGSSLSLWCGSGSATLASGEVVIMPVCCIVGNDSSLSYSRWGYLLIMYRTYVRFHNTRVPGI